jgi:hypothetical protein
MSERGLRRPATPQRRPRPPAPQRRPRLPAPQRRPRRPGHHPTAAGTTCLCSCSLVPQPPPLAPAHRMVTLLRHSLSSRRRRFCGCNVALPRRCSLSVWAPPPPRAAWTALPRRALPGGPPPPPRASCPHEVLASTRVAGRSPPACSWDTAQPRE